MAAAERHPTPDHSRRIAEWSLRATDACLAGVLLAAPLFFGGRHPFGLLIYAVVVALAATCWALHQLQTGAPTTRVRPVAKGVLLAAVGVLALQATPLPGAVLGVLSPNLAERLPLWGGEAGLPAWRTLSVNPWQTWQSLAALITHGVLFVVVTQRVRSPEDAGRVVQLVGAAGGGMAAIAVVQYLAGVDRLLGIYPLAYRDVDAAALGAFTTPNHCGHFLALGAVAALYELARVTHMQATTVSASKSAGQARATPQAAAVGWLVALAVIAVAVLLTFSRGAAIALVAGLTTTTALLALVGQVGGRQALQAGAAAVVLLVGLSWFDYERISGAAGGVSATDMQATFDTGSRQELWKANVRAFTFSPWLGLGAGAHGQYYAMFMQNQAPRWYTHAESGYLQVASETGVVGVGLLAVAIAATMFWCARALAPGRDRLTRGAAAVAAGAVIASLVHSFADFVWYVPACLAPVVMLAATAMRLSCPPTTGCGAAPPRGVGGLGLASLAPLAGIWFAVFTLTGPAAASFAVDDYHRDAKQLKRYSMSRLARVDDPSDHEAMHRVLQNRLFYVENMIAHTRAAAEHDSRDALVHLNLARKSLSAFQLCQALGDNPMGLDDIRQAAMASHFEDAQQVAEWVRRAFGESAELLLSARRHAWRSVSACPVQGEAYILLADLAFLDPASSGRTPRLVDQAIRVEPYTGGVLFDAGRHAYYAGDTDSALDIWRRAAAQQGGHRNQLAAALAALTPAQEFVTQFNPDWELTGFAFKHYQLLGREDQLRVLADHALRAAHSDDGVATWLRARRWQQAGQFQLDTGRPEKALECLEQAIAVDTTNYEYRRTLAGALFAAGRYEDADPHLRWCVARAPDDLVLRNKLEAIAKQRLSSGRVVSVTRTLLGGTKTTPQQAAMPPKSQAGAIVK